MLKTVDEIRIEELSRHYTARSLGTTEAKKVEAINEAAKAFAQVVIDTVSWSVDRDRATQAIREAAMMAKEAIVTHQPSDETAEFRSASGHMFQFVEA